MTDRPKDDRTGETPPVDPGGLGAHVSGKESRQIPETAPEKHFLPSPDPHIELDRERLDLDRARLVLDRERFALDQRFASRHLTTTIAITAIAVSVVQIMLEGVRADRDWNLHVAQFVSERGDDLFGNDPEKRLRARAIIEATFPSGRQRPLFRALESAVADSQAAFAWALADRRAGLEGLLQRFRFSPGDSASVDEADRMLRLLGASTIRFRGPDYVTAHIPAGYEVTIWAGTYNKRSCYGVRFGDPQEHYQASNDTYFEVCK